MSGTLRVVATPIGNLGDLSERARAALESADLVACEDTRRTGALLHHLGVKKRMVSLHEHNETRRTGELIALLRGGATVALVADAGTPLLCDPGFVLVREAVRHDIRVEALPGPSALLAALVTSGLPPYPFTFTGFPPRRSGKRRTFYRTLCALPHTLVVYESPHRLLPSLEDAASELGAARPAVLLRELTKLHEEAVRGTLGELLATVRGRGAWKGEIVLVIAGAEPPGRQDTDREGAVNTRGADP